MDHAGAELDLGDPLLAGVFFVTIDDIATLDDAVHDAGLLARRIDLTECTDKASLLALMSNALTLPEGRGRNWDALADCLTDLSWMAADGYVIVLDHADAFARANPTDFATALSIFQDAADTWREDGIPFWALIGTATDGIAWLRELE